MDSTAYFEVEDKRERVLAIKKLKNEFERKYEYKLIHQKKIVSKMKGGCSYFIPKYFAMESAIDPEDMLMMQWIQGTELDLFIMSRKQTISLSTKLCLLINVIQGLRYLASYSIVHLDIKPINILVCKQLITKIIDYGQAYHKQVCSDKIY